MKKISKRLYSIYVGCIHKSSVAAYEDFFISQPEDGQCKMPKYIVVLYVINSTHMSTIIQGESLARGPKLLSIKNYVTEIMT